MLKQVDAVYAAIVSTTGFTGETKCELTSEQSANVRAILLEGFRSNKISFSKGDFNTYYSTEAEQKSYVSGLLNNHLRKDKRLNGGTKYEAKNPGSRSSDPTLQAMRNLLKMPDLTPEARTEIEAEINAHIASTQVAKVPQINWEALPESLKAKFNK